MGEKAKGTLEELILNEKQEISVESALKMALDIARGIQQLHTVPMGPVSHNDIMPHQFLFTDQGTLVLNDLDSMGYLGQTASNKKCLPSKYGDFFKDEKHDVYRAAFILWMLRGRQRPNRNLFRKSNEVRPDVEKMSDYPQAMQNLIVEAWDADPTKCPSAIEMTQRIEAVLSKHNSSVV